MRILIFHGYLLGGTGSNVYNAGLAAALRAAGHEVHLLAQERRPEELDFVDAVGEWRKGRLELRTLREPVRCTVYRPDIGEVLPVYVADRYEGVEARPYPGLSEEEVEAYVAANVAAVRDVAERVAPDVALANHLIMGPAILARALGDEVPFAAKVHGSALEYTVKPHPRFLPYAREGIDAARAVLVGSRHTAESLWSALDDPGLPARTRLGPPGVDVELFRPRGDREAVAGVERLAAQLEAQAEAQAGAPPREASAFTRDPAEAARGVATLRPAEDRLVIFIGKLIVSKGIDLLLAAWPLVLAREPRARLVIVGFGGWRDAAERLVEALAAGDLEAARAIALEGRAAEGGPAEPLRHLAAHLDRLSEDEPHPELRERVVFTGRLHPDALADLLPACEALVFPSTFPEAYGMVAAEAAACGVYPVSANHSGLAEVSRKLEEAVPREAAGGLRFDVSDRAVEDLAACVSDWLEAPAQLRRRTRAALAETALEHFSWAGVARGVIAAAQGRLDELPRVG